MNYQALADSIKSFEERKDSKVKDTVNCAKLPAFTYVLCAVITNSLNSWPPERLVSIFNATCNDDQKKHDFYCPGEVMFLSDVPPENGLYSTVEHQGS
jgi:hypothetical protein